MNRHSSGKHAVVLAAFSLAGLACLCRPFEGWFGGLQRFIAGMQRVAWEVEHQMVPTIRPQLEILATQMATRVAGDLLDNDIFELSELEVFLSMLEQMGLQAEFVDEVDQPFFSVSAKRYQVEGQEILVFEYAQREEAMTESTLVSPDGATVDKLSIDWADTPHFYRSGKLIILYVGEDSRLLVALTALLGPPFAGGG